MLHADSGMDLAAWILLRLQSGEFPNPYFCVGEGRLVKYSHGVAACQLLVESNEKHTLAQNDLKQNPKLPTMTPNHGPKHRLEETPFHCLRYDANLVIRPRIANIIRRPLRTRRM